MDKFLIKLAERLQIPDADTVSADEAADWPDGKLDKLIKTGVLTEIQHSTGIICDVCEENCYIEPDIRTIPDTDKAVGVHICPRNPDVGRIEIDLERLRQWKINKAKLEELGYQTDTGLEPIDELITVQEASIILGVDKGTISRLASENKIKHNGESGTKRRISKLSVLLYKNNRETEQAKKDFYDLRKDARKIPYKH